MFILCETINVLVKICLGFVFCFVLVCRSIERSNKRKSSVGGIQCTVQQSLVPPVALTSPIVPSRPNSAIPLPPNTQFARPPGSCLARRSDFIALHSGTNFQSNVRLQRIAISAFPNNAIPWRSKVNKWRRLQGLSACRGPLIKLYWKQY